MTCLKVADRFRRYLTSYAVLPVVLGLILSPGPVCAGWKIPFDGSLSKPVIEQGIIYIGTDTGAVHAIDATTGKTVWKFQPGTGGAPGPAIIEIDKGDIQSAISAVRNRMAEGRNKIDATPVIDDGIVYIGSLDRYFYAIKAKNGQPVWSVKLGEIINKAFVEEESIIVYGGPRTRHGWSPGIHVLDRDGSIRWSTTDKQMATYPAIHNGVLYYSLYQPETEEKHPFFTLNSSELETGKPVWVTELKGRRPHTAVIHEGRIYVTAYVGGETISVPGGVSFTPRTVHLYALDVEKGKVLWNVTAGEPVSLDAPISIGKDLLFLATEEGLQSFDRETGNRRWIVRAAFSPYALHVGRYLYAFKGGFGEDSVLVALSLQDGKQVWKARLGGSGKDIVEEEGVLYVTANKDLLALDSATGKRLWKFTTWSFFNPGTRLTAAPIIHEGQLIIPSMTETFIGKSPIQGYLYSIDLQTGKTD